MGKANYNKTFYWIAKGFISFFLLYSAWHTYSHPSDLKALGFPDYFGIELVVSKIAGAIILFLPMTTARMKEWIYTGLFIVLISALIAHVCNKDGISKIGIVIINLILVSLSIWYVSRIDYHNFITKKQKSLR